MWPYLPSSLPGPVPARPEQAEFWDNCRDKHLAFQHCRDCGHLQHPPLPLCGKCQSPHYDWREAEGEARLYTYTIVHHSLLDATKECVPYNVVVVIYPELGDIRFVSNVVDLEPDDLVIGMPLRLVWDDFRNGLFLPRYAGAAVQ